MLCSMHELLTVPVSRGFSTCAAVVHMDLFAFCKIGIRHNWIPWTLSQDVTR
jgi:hypothetical protein